MPCARVSCPQVAAGGDPDGTLDFYAVHGYAIWNEGPRDRLINMFLNPKSHWKVDKPILVGEHWEQVRVRAHVAWCAPVAAPLAGPLSARLHCHGAQQASMLPAWAPGVTPHHRCCCLACLKHHNRHHISRLTQTFSGPEPMPMRCTLPHPFLPLPAPQVMPYPSTITVDNYLHLYDTGYAGGWGWAWFNVTESYNYTTGTVLGRGIAEHKCRGSLRRLLAGLPQRLKYSVKRPQAAAAGATSPAAVVG